MIYISTGGTGLYLSIGLVAIEYSIHDFTNSLSNLFIERVKYTYISNAHVNVAHERQVTLMTKECHTEARKLTTRPAVRFFF